MRLNMILCIAPAPVRVILATGQHFACPLCQKPLLVAVAARLKRIQKASVSSWNGLPCWNSTPNAVKFALLMVGWGIQPSYKIE